MSGNLLKVPRILDIMNADHKFYFFFFSNLTIGPLLMHDLIIL